MVLPHAMAMAEFQPYTATGKLKAVMIPITPSGFQFSSSACPGLSLGITCVLYYYYHKNYYYITSYLPAEHPAEPHGVVADVYILLHLADPLGQNLAHLETDQLSQGLQFVPE